ncbi:MAG: LptF/LptG family permease, partial [Bacteroidales bacterium]|nr:LptF/LptG family permease [Bacteroidales bacterium]
VDNFSAWNNTAYRFTLEDIDGGRLKRKLTADSAVWDSTFGGWHLRNWFIREYSEGLEDRVTSGEKKDTVIALTVTDFYENNRTVEKLSGRQLNQLIDKQKMRGDANVMYAEIEKHTRTSMPFSCIILTIMGVSLSSRKRRGGTGWNLAIGIGLAFSYILFQRFSQMFVFTGALPAWLALWIPNVLYTIIAAVLYDRARR